MPDKKQPDLVNGPVDIAVELTRMFEDRFFERLGLEPQPDPVKQMLKDMGVRVTKFGKV